MSSYLEHDMLEKRRPKTPEEIEQYLISNDWIARTVVRSFRSSDIYEDMLQEAYIGMLKGLATYDENKKVKLSTYVFCCARNEVKQWLRKSNAKCRAGGTISLEAFGGEQDENRGRLLDQIASRKFAEDEGKTMEHILYRKMVFEAAMHVICEELDMPMQITITRSMDDVPQNQIAKELGVSQSHVSKTLKRATTIVHNRLLEMGYTDPA